MANLPRPVRPPFRHSCAGLLAALAIFGGCGGDDAVTGAGTLAELAPPDAPIFFEATLRPSADQSAALVSLASRLGLPDPGRGLISLVDASLADNGLPLSYSGDVEPWVGDHGAVFIRSFETASAAGTPDFALLLEVDDEEAARELVDGAFASNPETTEERSYGGHDYAFETDPSGGGFALGLIDDAFFAGTEASFKVAVDSKDGQSLAASDEYADGVEAIGGDPLATLLIEPGTVIEAAIAAGEIASEDAEPFQALVAGPLSQAMVAGLSVADASAALDVAVPTMETAAADSDAALIERLPAESWAAVGVPDLGPALERTIDQLGASGLPGAGSIEAAVHRATGLDVTDDITAWLGDASAYVAGTTPETLEAGLRAETTDSGGPQALLEAARERIAREAPRATIGGPPPGAEDGFSVSLGDGRTVDAGEIGSELVVAAGRGAAGLFDPPQALGDSAGYRAGAEALGDDFEASTYLDLPALFAAAEAGGAGGESSYEAAKPYLDRLSYVIAGSRYDDGRVISRLALGVAGD